MKVSELNGAALEQILEDKGLGIKKTAKLTGIKMKDLRSFMQGGRSYPQNIRANILEALGVEIEPENLPPAKKPTLKIPTQAKTTKTKGTLVEFIVMDDLTVKCKIKGKLVKLTHYSLDVISDRGRLTISPD